MGRGNPRGVCRPHYYQAGWQPGQGKPSWSGSSTQVCRLASRVSQLGWGGLESSASRLRGLTDLSGCKHFGGAAGELECQPRLMYRAHILAAVRGNPRGVCRPHGYQAGRQQGEGKPSWSVSSTILLPASGGAFASHIVAAAGELECQPRLM